MSLQRSVEGREGWKTGKVRARINHVDHLQHSHQVLHDCKHGKAVVLHVSSAARDEAKQGQRQAEGARLCE